MSKCKYFSRYKNYETTRRQEFTCDEDVITNSDFCMFHDASYYKFNSEEILQHFVIKIENAVMSETALYCIGYNLPSITFGKSTFSHPVYFNEAQFHGNARFKSIEFKDVDFSDVKFYDRADFTSVKFHGKVNFKNAHFQNIAIFKKITNIL